MGFVFWRWEMRLDVNFKERSFLLSLPATQTFEMAYSKFGNPFKGPLQGKCQSDLSQGITSDGSYEAFLKTNHLNGTPQMTFNFRSTSEI